MLVRRRIGYFARCTMIDFAGQSEGCNHLIPDQFVVDGIAEYQPAGT